MPNVPVLNSYCPLVLEHPLNQGLLSEWSTLAQPHGRTGHTTRRLFDLGTGKGVLRNGTIATATTWGGQQNRRSGYASLVMTANANDGVDTGSYSGPPGGFTFTAWIRPTNTTATDIIAAQWAGGGNSYLQFFRTNPGAMAARIFESSTIWIGRSASSVLAALQWQQVAFTWDGGITAAAIKLYRNGRQVDTTNDNAGSFASVGTGAQTFWLGRQATGQQYGGFIGDVSTYNRGLSPAEIAALYQESLLGNPTRYNWLESGWYGTSPPPPPSTAGNLLLLGVGW